MLKVIGLGKEYKNKVALNDINLTFPEKGLVIIKGESGCGKSTLLNLLTASDMPTYGKIIFEGVEITPKNYESYRLNYCSNIYQDYMLIEDLTVGENIELALQACGQDYTADDVKEILQSVGISEEYIAQKASKLSGGEKQRVAIARAISKRNAMIFADEPTGNLDSKNGDTVMEILKEISKERLVVVVSHNERQNAAYGDYFVELFDGVVKFQNLPEIDNWDVKNSELQKKKSKLKPKSVARLAFWGFEKNRIKTVVSIIAVIAMCVLNIVSTVALVGDINLALAKSLEKCKGKNVFAEFSAYEHIYEEIDYGEAKKKFKDKIGYEYSDVLNFEIRPEHYELDEEYSKRANTRRGYIRKAIIYDSEIGVDVKVLYGDFPKKPNDIMLPSFYAEYMTVAFCDFKCDDIKELVGKEMKYNSGGIRDSFGESVDYYPFNICGIFDEGAYLNDYENLSDVNSRYLEGVNLMAGCVILAPNADKVIFNNAYVFNRRGLSSGTLVDFYPTNIGDAPINPYCYDEYSDYALSYAPLEKGEVYLDVDVASEYGISAGDRVDLSTWEFQRKQGDGGLFDFELVEVDRVAVTVKQLIDLPEKNNFAIFNRHDYVDTLLIKDNSDKTWGFYFNTKNIKDNYAFFNKLSEQGKKTGLIKYGLNGSVFTENSSALHSLYNLFIEYRYFLILPIMVLSLVGIVALGFVSLSYLISSKGKSYNILRSLGFGKSHIASILAVQVFTVIIAECIFGIAFGALSCFLFGKSFVNLVDAGVTLSIANEVVMPMGYQAPLIISLISLVIGGIMTLIKTKALFAKSIIETKTN